MPSLNTSFIFLQKSYTQNFHPTSFIKLVVIGWILVQTPFNNLIKSWIIYIGDSAY